MLRKKTLLWGWFVLFGFIIAIAWLVAVGIETGLRSDFFSVEYFDNDVFFKPVSQQGNQIMVQRVIDGDTIVVFDQGKEISVRLIGINAPESVDPRKKVECFGREASARMKELVEKKHVRLEEDPTQENEDRYGRLLRYVFLQDGTNVNLKMIEDGYAYEYTYLKPYQYQEQFKRAQQDAQNQKKGLWSDDACKGKR